MTWHYLVVIKDETYSFCEVYLDDHDQVTSWTAPFCDPAGDSPEELLQDTANMVSDAICYKPVKFESLHVGMKLEKVFE